MAAVRRALAAAPKEKIDDALAEAPLAATLAVEDDVAFAKCGCEARNARCPKAGAGGTRCAKTTWSERRAASEKRRDTDMPLHQSISE
jgi:hypothetical protein